MKTNTVHNFFVRCEAGASSHHTALTRHWSCPELWEEETGPAGRSIRALDIYLSTRTSWAQSVPWSCNRRALLRDTAAIVRAENTPAFGMTRIDLARNPRGARSMPWMSTAVKSRGRRLSVGFQAVLQKQDCRIWADLS